MGYEMLGCADGFLTTNNFWKRQSNSPKVDDIDTSNGYIVKGTLTCII